MDYMSTASIMGDFSSAGIVLERGCEKKVGQGKVLKVPFRDKPDVIKERFWKNLRQYGHLLGWIPGTFEYEDITLPTTLWQLDFVYQSFIGSTCACFFFYHLTFNMISVYS